MENADASNELAVELSTTVKNSTGRTMTGLWMRGMIVDSQNSPVRQRTMAIIPVRQRTLELDEEIKVRILLKGINSDSERAHMSIEVAALRF